MRNYIVFCILCLTYFTISQYIRHITLDEEPIGDYKTSCKFITYVTLLHIATYCANESSLRDPLK